MLIVKRFFQQKIGVAQMKRGDTILYNNKFMSVASVACVGSGRGSRQYNLQLQDHSSTSICSLKPTIATVFEKYALKDIPMQYLYFSEDNDGGGLLTFIHQETMEQIVLKSTLINAKFLSLLESGHQVKIRCADITASSDGPKGAGGDSFSSFSLQGNILAPLSVLAIPGSYRCRVKEILGVRDSTSDGKVSYNILLEGGLKVDSHVKVKEGDHVLINTESASFVGRCLGNSAATATSTSASAAENNK